MAVHVQSEPPVSGSSAHLLGHLPGIDFPGRDALVAQARTARVRRIDRNGTATS